jgi:hypothetical protein
MIDQTNSDSSAQHTPESTRPTVRGIDPTTQAALVPSKSATIPDVLTTQLDEIDAIHRALLPTKPLHPWKTLRQANQFKVGNPYQFGLLIIQLLLIIATVHFWTIASINNDIGQLWISVGTGGIAFLLWASRTILGLVSEVGRASYDLIETMIENNRQERTILEVLLTFKIGALQQVSGQYEQRLLVLETRFALLLGSVRQAGLLATTAALVGGYFGIMEKLPSIKSGSSLVIGLALGSMIAAVLLQDLIDNIRWRATILNRGIELLKETQSQADDKDLGSG